MSVTIQSAATAGRSYPTKSGPVPAQFKGLARQFSNRQVDPSQPFVKASNVLARKIEHRLDKLGNIRLEGMQDYERARREISPFPELHNYDFDRKKGVMLIADYYLSSSWMRRSAWSGDEDDTADLNATNSEHTIDFNLSLVKLTRTSAEMKHRPLAAFGSHSLGRRYQRGFDCTDAAIMRDLWCVVNFWEDFCLAQRPYPADYQFSISSPGGTWSGEAMNNKRDPDGPSYLSVRTFF
jgi:hypothetical protein